MLKQIIRLFQKPDHELEWAGYLKKAYQAQQEVCNILRERKELQAVGIAPCSKGYFVKVNLSYPLPEEVTEKLPNKVDGVPIQTEIVGPAVVF